MTASTKIFAASLVGVLIIIVFLLSLPGSAFAQQMKCGQYEKLIRMLADKHGEHLFDSHANDLGTIELWVNLKTGSYSLLSHAGKAVCLIRTGRLDPKALLKRPDPQT